MGEAEKEVSFEVSTWIHVVLLPARGLSSVGHQAPRMARPAAGFSFPCLRELSARRLRCSEHRRFSRSHRPRPPHYLDAPGGRWEHPGSCSFLLLHLLHEGVRGVGACSGRPALARVLLWSAALLWSPTLAPPVWLPVSSQLLVHPRGSQLHPCPRTKPALLDGLLPLRHPPRTAPALTLPGPPPRSPLLSYGGPLAFGTHPPGCFQPAAPAAPGDLPAPFLAPRSLLPGPACPTWRGLPAGSELLWMICSVSLSLCLCLFLCTCLSSCLLLSSSPCVSLSLGVSTSVSVSISVSATLTSADGTAVLHLLPGPPPLPPLRPRSCPTSARGEMGSEP